MRKRWLLVVWIGLLLFGVTVVNAQESSGTLVLGQPATAQITAAGETLRFDYTLSQTSQVSMQALSDSIPPIITIVRAETGEVVAQANNDANAFTVGLNALLPADTYVVQVGATNNATGLVILVMQNETPLDVNPLTMGQSIQGALDASAPIALYSLDAPDDSFYVYVDSDSTDGGVRVHFGDGVTGRTIASSDEDVIGARYRFGGGDQQYQVEISANTGEVGKRFTICVAAVSANTCEGGQTAPATSVPVVTATPIVEVTVVSACTVSSNVGGGVNIRQSATTGSIIVGILPDGTNADVLGIVSGGAFYNIVYNGINGWVAASVVNASGDCSVLSIINPPPVIAPTQLPAPTQPPAPPTPSGPCLLSLTSPTYVYSTTNAQIDYLFDQVQAGELIPTGRLADNSWWKLNYYDTWIPTSAFGSTVTVSGNCSNLPIVAAP